jgi:hypothetical protein
MQCLAVRLENYITRNACRFYKPEASEGDFGTFIPGFFRVASQHGSIRNVSIVFLLTYPNNTNAFVTAWTCNPRLPTMSESILCANCGYTITNDIVLPTTPVPDLLGGNYVVSEFHAQMICDTISAAQADISRLDGEITRLQVVLDGLTNKRDALQTYTHSHTALVAPIRRLPPEVLSEIFLRYNDKNSLSYLQRLNTAPLLLGSVCSRWRAIALSTPRLWTSFALAIRPKYLKSDAMLAKTWLARAGTCPLTICLTRQGHYQNAMKPLMNVFLLHCEQWYDIHLDVLPPVLGSLAPAKNRLPRLQKLYLGCELEETLNIFECAPQLRWLHLISGLDPSMVKVPWNQIEYLDMGVREVDRCLDLLRTTPNLEKCVVLIPSLESRQSHSPIQLPRFRSMIITGDPTHLFDTLLLPELHEICINSRWTATSQLTSFLSRCSLAKLSLQLKNPPSDDEMIQILRTCPSLVQLDLRWCTSQCMTKSFFAQFAYRGDPENSATQQLVPMLRTMNIDYTGTEFNIPDFANAIESRIMSNSEGPAPDDIAGLQTVEIHYPSTSTCSLDSPILSRLRQLRGTRLEIRFLQGDKDIL